MNYAVISNKKNDDFAEYLNRIAKEKEEVGESTFITVCIPRELSLQPTILYHDATWEDVGMASQYLNYAFVRWDKEDEDIIDEEDYNNAED